MKGSLIILHFDFALKSEDEKNASGEMGNGNSFPFLTIKRLEDTELGYNFSPSKPNFVINVLIWVLVSRMVLGPYSASQPF